LNACYSATQARAIAEHIPYVVGMSESIGDDAAILFAIGFYKALAGGKSIPKAFEFGKVEIRLHGIPEHGTPVLIELRSQGTGRPGCGTALRLSNCRYTRTLGRHDGRDCPPARRDRPAATLAVGPA
jgi:hypothetical protein